MTEYIVFDVYLQKDNGERGEVACLLQEIVGMMAVMRKEKQDAQDEDAIREIWRQVATVADYVGFYFFLTLLTISAIIILAIIPLSYELRAE